jgi:anthranilate synthase component I
MITLHHHSLRLLADTLTPVSAYLRLRDHFPQALLLESSDYHSASDSYSFICLDPISSFTADGLHYRFSLPGEKEQSGAAAHPREIWKIFRDYCASFTCAEGPEAPRIGLFGYTTFEAVQYMEDIRFSPKLQEAKHIPDLRYQLFRYVIVIDHFRDDMRIIKTDTEPVAADDPGPEHIASLLRIGRIDQFSFRAEGSEESNMNDDDFRELVDRGIAHCHRGDVFQVVLSREFRQPYTGDDFNVYRSIRSINPSPYLFYFDYGSYRIFGSSPEAQLRVSSGKAVINPIAGTVRRTGDEKTDKERAQALSRDPKENAEHIMLVDLARNDLSRSADGVQVEVYAEIQYFSHVIHMVSAVTGELREARSALDVYGDTFPAGTLSGAPKHRAMQIIDACEPTPRSFYGGAIGFIGFDGSLNHAIIIRSVLSKDNTLTYQAGAGVVISSSRDGELDEVTHKVAAMRHAIRNAQHL